MNKGSPTRRYDTGIMNIKLFSLKKPKSFVIFELKSFIKYNVIKSKIAFIALLCLMLMPFVCSAATINYPNDYSSLQAAINAANLGDTVLVSIGAFNEPNEITLNDGINIKGAGAVRSDSKITCSIRGASNCTIENLTLEPPDSADYILTIPPTSRTMKLKACYIYAYKPILIEGSGITLENNIITGDQSRFNQSLPLSLILLRNNPETDTYPNTIKNNTLSIKVESETPLDGYLLGLSSSGNIKIANNILDAVYDSPEGLKVFTSGKPFLIEGVSIPTIEYNAYVGYIDEASLGEGNIAASALSPEEPLPNNVVSLPDISIAKEAGLTVTPDGSYALEIGAFGEIPDYVLPLITNVRPFSGSSISIVNPIFSANLSDNAGLQYAELALNGSVVYTKNLSGLTDTISYQISLSNGNYTYSLRVVDLAGNERTASTTFNISVIISNPGPGSGCFLAGTPILMANNTTKPIENIKAGDKILAFDEKTSSFKPDKVKQVFVIPDNNEGYLVINGHIKVTPHHRFLINDGREMIDEGRWKEAGLLKLGDKLTKEETSVTPTRCTDIHLVGVETVTSIEKINETVTVYNLEVNTYHTFIADGVVVHNANMRNNLMIK